MFNGGPIVLTLSYLNHVYYLYVKMRITPVNLFIALFIAIIFLSLGLFFNNYQKFGNTLISRSVWPWMIAFISVFSLFVCLFLPRIQYDRSHDQYMNREIRNIDYDRPILEAQHAHENLGLYKLKQSRKKYLKIKHLSPNSNKIKNTSDYLQQFYALEDKYHLYEKKYKNFRNKNHNYVLKRISGPRYWYEYGGAQNK